MSEAKHTDARERFLEERSSGIGGSDAPIVMGVDTFGKGKLALYMEKRGEVEAPDLSSLSYVEVGKEIEPAVASMYVRRTLRIVRRPDGTSVRSPYVGDVQRHPEYPFIIGHQDYVAEAYGKVTLANGSEAASLPAPAEGPGTLETKFGTIFKAKDFEEDIPLAYQIQVQHYLLVTGNKWGSLAAILGTGEFVYKDIKRNDFFIDALVIACKEFWERVQNGDPPKAGTSEGDIRALNALYKQSDSEKSVPLPMEAIGIHEELVATKAQIKELEQAKKEKEVALKEMMKDATYGVLPLGAGRYKWKQSDVEGYTVKPFKKVDFRHLKT